MTRFKTSWPRCTARTGAGKEARPPAMMAMAMLVQGYLGMSDAEMIELTVVDLRVQMVLGCLGAEAPAVFARRVAGVSRAADRRRPGSPRARTHRRVGEGHQGVRPPQAAQDPARGDRFESAGGRGTRRRHVQLAGPCGAQRGALCRRPARVDRRAGVPCRRAFPCSWSRASSARSTSTGTMRSRRPTAITTFSRQLDALQAWIARQLPEALAQPPLKEQVETLVQIRTQDLEPDPQGGGCAHSRGRRGGSTGLDRGPGDASRPQEQEQAVQRLQAAHCRGRRSRADPRLRHHAGESSRGRSDAVLDGRPGAPGTRRRPPADRSRVHQQHARRRRAQPARHDRLQTVEVAQRPPVSEVGLHAQSPRPHDRVPERPSATASRSAPSSSSIPTSAIAVPCARNAPPPSSATGAPSPSRRTSRCSSGCASRSRPPRDAPPCESAR